LGADERQNRKEEKDDIPFGPEGQIAHAQGDERQRQPYGPGLDGHRNAGQSDHGQGRPGIMRVGRAEKPRQRPVLVDEQGKRIAVRPGPVEKQEGQSERLRPIGIGEGYEAKQG
jgi:hypothetical protein